MKLYVTIGNANGEWEEREFDLEAPVTYIGLELPDNQSPTGRMTILRMPFHTHGTTIHTICGVYDDDADRVTSVER